MTLEVIARATADAQAPRPRANTIGETGMTDQAARARRLHSLHIDDLPLLLFNAWDAGSAKAVAGAGAAAIATGSWSVAAANGFADGESIPRAFALDNLARIVAAAGDLPVTVDLERGYDDVAETVRGALAAGAAGCNLEDGLAEGLRDTAEQASRLAAARAAAEAAGIPMFLNARTDLFLQAPAEAHDAALLARALERGRAFAAAGADGLFLPGLADEALIAVAVAQSPLPVNVMVGARTPPLARLAALGVARVSHGPGPYLLAMRALAGAALAGAQPSG